MRIHKYIRTTMPACIHIISYTFINICRHIHTCIHTFIDITTYMFTNTYTHTYIYIHIHNTYIHIHLYIIHTYIHTYTGPHRVGEELIPNVQGSTACANRDVLSVLEQAIKNANIRAIP